MPQEPREFKSVIQEPPLPGLSRTAMSCVQVCMTDQAPTPARSSRLRIALIAYSVAAFVVVPLSLFWAVLSIMASTTTTNTEFVNVYILANAAFPLLWLVGVVGGWVAWFLRRDRLGWVLMASPAVPLVISIAMLAVWPLA